MNFKTIGGLEIFRPSDSTEIEMDKLSENNLRSKFSVGRYSKKEEVNEIIQHQFNFYENILNELIPLVGSRNF